MIKDNEKNLQNFHKKAIENSNKTLQRSESLQRKYNELERKLEKVTEEKDLLLEKNREMVDLCKDWE